MRVSGVQAENPLEWALLRLGLVPTPLLQSFGMVGARALLVATKVGVFDALEVGPPSSAELASRLDLHPETARRFLNFLVSERYLRLRDGRYGLSRLSRRWLLSSSPRSLRDSILMRFVEWDWIGHLEEVIRSGVAVDVHHTMTPAEWGLYQRSMRSSARVFGAELARRTPVPPGARTMLDIGGSHGYYSVAICRRHPGLKSIVLDLPEAVEHAAPILAKENMGDRVVHRAGDVLVENLGEVAFDLVFMANLAHNLNESDNRAVARKAAAALRPGGLFVIHDLARRRSDLSGGEMGTMADLYFAVMSKAGAWSPDQMADWQRDAGLTPQRVKRLVTLPGTVLQTATKPSRPAANTFASNRSRP